MPSLTRDLRRLAAAAAIGLLLATGYTTFRIWDQGNRDERRPADAIVVLGAAQYDGRPSPIFRARLDHAVELFEAGIAPTIVTTGGRAEGDRTTEAEAGRAYAIARGVPEDAIIVEDQARTTLESIRLVGGLLRSHGIRDVVFVSDRPHLLRVLRMADDEGIAGWGSPTPSSPIGSDVAATVEATAHELGALGVYFLTGESP